MAKLFNHFKSIRVLNCWSDTNHEIAFHVIGVVCVILLLPLLFLHDRDKDETDGSPLEDMVQSVDFKVMVYASIAAAFPLTVDLMVDFFTTENTKTTKQLIPRVTICGTLLGTALLHLYFTIYLGSVYATWVILHIRSVTSCAVLLHQCHIRCGHVVTPAFSYLILFSWNIGTMIKSYGGNLHTTLILGRCMRFVAIALSTWGFIDHVRMYYKGKLKDWYSKWHRTFFELLLAVVISVGILCNLLWQQNQMYLISPVAILVLSYDEIVFLVMMSIIITNEYRHETAKAQMQLEVKRMFVKYVSHEVRTPLNSCMLGIQYMKEIIQQPTDASILEITDILDEVSEGCNTAIDFMNNLLLYEKVDSMDLPLYLKQEDLSNLCSEVLQSFRMSARQLGVNLNLHIHESIKALQAGPLHNLHQPSLHDANANIDRPKIVIVLRNLMSNALKFTPENGEVSLSVIPVCLPETDETVSTSGFDAYSGRIKDPRQVGHITPKCVITDTTHFRVVLSDSGRGMAVENQLTGKIFDPLSVT
jgi:signal transduction histidine kinase